MNDLHYATTIGATPEAVYAALTESAALQSWLDEHAEVNLADGVFDFWGRFSPEGQPGRKRLIAFDPNRGLAFSWQLSGATCTVTLALEQLGTSETRLTLAHTNVTEREGAEPYVFDFWNLALDNLANYAEGRAISPRCDFAAAFGNTARCEIDIPADPERVFHALLDPAEVGRWAEGQAEIEPEVGGRYSFGWNHGPLKILELEPGKRLAYSWNYSEPGDTVVHWELDGSNGQTRLTLVHSGFANKRDADGYQLGWQAFLAKIRRMIEVGPRWAPISVETRQQAEVA